MAEKEIGLSSGVDTGVDIEKSKHVDPTMEKHSHDADEAMKAIEELNGETIELDEATNRRLLSVIDWHMMPIMCFIYGLNYLDSMPTVPRTREMIETNQF
jgi:ACS family allantoate permease-like MFS transporter